MFPESTLYTVAVLEGTDLVIRAINGTLRKPLPAGQLIGRPVREAYGEMLGPQPAALCELCYRTGEPQDGYVWQLQSDLGDGNVHSSYWDFRFVPVFGRDGRPTGVVKRGTDVTERVLQRRQSARPSC